MKTSFSNSHRIEAEINTLRQIRIRLIKISTEFDVEKTLKQRKDITREIKRTNKKLYELTGNDMYLWLGGHYNELENADQKAKKVFFQIKETDINEKVYSKLKFKLVE